MVKQLNIAMVVHCEEDGGYWAHFPELPGCFTQGNTLPQLREHAVDAVSGWLEVTQALGNPLPDTGVLVETIEVPIDEIG